MKTPVTAIDARFSDKGTVATGWDETAQVLEQAELFWICTVRADGRPHLTPLVAVWLDETLYFCTGENEQKYVNMSSNTNVLLLTGCNTWDRGLDVAVEGKAVRVTDEELLERLAVAWLEKWDGRWQWSVADGVFHHPGGFPVPVFAVEQAKVLAFGKGTFTVTRHVF
ncbi:MAG TPA: pyridoxamine 5'-phosphate oxidase family protein [Streptosporangiaceae bacterium]|nr:pyridoxamine 5'-phosphate oxidase family protein [Streptosporangiaceae bacterium]